MNKKYDQLKKLALRRTTMRNLSVSDLGRVAGGLSWTGKCDTGCRTSCVADSCVDVSQPGWCAPETYDGNSCGPTQCNI